jgi:hypothetical protein
MFRNILYKGMSSLGTLKAKLFDQASRNCRETQEQHLFRILHRNTHSSYGRKHGFHALKTLTDFKKSVPINTYDSIFPYVERSMSGETNVLTEETPLMFATTSGTTGSRKYIPVTRSYINEFRQASIVSGFHLLRTHPGITRGVVLSVFSAAEEAKTVGGIPCGAISGRLYLDEPKLVQKHITPVPYEVFVIKDYETRYYSILRCALTLPVGCIYTLNPSTIMLLSKSLEMHAPRLIKDVAEGIITTNVELDGNTKAAIAPFLKADLKRAKLV